MDTLTTAEVQKRLQVSRAVLYRWRREGVGPRAIKLGSAVRYPVADLEAWLAGLTDDVGQAAGNSGQHTVSPAPSPVEGESGSRERLDGPAAYPQRDAS
jgi:excisionase family DNA binding protein